MNREELKKELGKAIGESHPELIEKTVSFDYLKELCGENAELLTPLYKIKECAYKFIEAIIEIKILFDRSDTKQISKDEFKENLNSALLEQKNQELGIEENMRGFISLLKKEGKDVGWADKIVTTHTGYEKFAISFVFNELMGSASDGKEIKG